MSVCPPPFQHRVGFNIFHSAGVDTFHSVGVDTLHSVGADTFHSRCQHQQLCRCQHQCQHQCQNQQMTKTWFLWFTFRPPSLRDITWKLLMSYWHFSAVSYHPFISTTIYPKILSNLLNLSCYIKLLNLSGFISGNFWVEMLSKILRLRVAWPGGPSDVWLTDSHTDYTAPSSSGAPGRDRRDHTPDRGLLVLVMIISQGVIIFLSEEVRK